MNKSIRILFFIVAVFCFAEMKAQLPDSLSVYLKTAAENNPLVQQRFYEYKAALEKLPQAAALPDPELNIGVFVQPMELIEGKQVADFQLMQMFPWFGTLNAAKDEMSLMAKARLEQFRSAQLDVFFEVEKSFYELYKLRKEQKIAEKNLQLLNSIERIALVRFRTSSPGTGSSSSSSEMNNSGTANTSSQPMGMGSSQNQSQPSSMPSQQGNSMSQQSNGGSLADLYRIQIETGEMKDNIASLENRKREIMAKFNAVLGRSSQTPVFIPDTIVADTSANGLSLLHDTSFRKNPMLEMIRYEQESLEARKKMASRMGYPMFGIGVDYSLINKSDMSESEMNGKDMIMPMVKLSLPVYRGNYKARKKEADLLKSASALNYESTERSVNAEYYEALGLYLDSKRRIKLFSDQAELANKTLKLMMAGFSSSGGSLTDILRIRQQTLEYENKSIEAVSDYFLAAAWIRKLTASDLQK